jgi:serine/threonine protein kinase
VEFQRGMEIGDYVLQDPLGKGQFSTVWRAAHKRTGIEAALKINQESDPVQLKRFAREAELLQSLNHSNIVPFRGYDVQGDVLFIAMKYVKGMTLQDLIDNRKRTNPRGPIMSLLELERFIKPLVNALEYLHTRGVIHRDLKPANILIEEGTNQVIITDFGLAKSAFDQQRTTAGFDFTGTVFYTTPEQLSNSYQLSPATDLYSLAAITYELLTGNPPFTDPNNNPFTIMVMHLNNPVTPPSYMVKTLPEGLDGVFKRALEKDPTRRYRSVKEFYSAFLAVAGPTNELQDNSVYVPVKVMPEARSGISAPARAPVVLPSYVTPSQTAPVKSARSGGRGLVIGLVVIIILLALVLAVLIFIYFTR